MRAIAGTLLLPLFCLELAESPAVETVQLPGTTDLTHADGLADPVCGQVRFGERRGVINGWV